MPAFGVRVAAVVAIVSLPAASRAGSCVASVALEGPTDLTSSIASGLKAHGLSVGTMGTCADRIVRARVRHSAGGTYELRIEDGSGRTSDRVLTELGTAVSLIESWAVEEDADLLGGPAPQGPGAPTAVVEAATAPNVDRAAAGLHVYGGLGGSLGSDRSLSGGGFAGTCARLGRGCLGAEVWVGRDLGLLGDTSDSGTTRFGADLMVMGALPLTHGLWLLMPRIGVGLGWTRTHVDSEEPDMPAQTRNTLGFRGVLGVLGGISVSRGVALALDLDAVVAPWASPAPADVTPMSPFPGEPRLSGRAAIACVVTP
jgi:hypothetical protein